MRLTAEELAARARRSLAASPETPRRRAIWIGDDGLMRLGRSQDMIGLMESLGQKPVNYPATR